MSESMTTPGCKTDLIDAGNEILKLRADISRLTEQAAAAQANEQKMREALDDMLAGWRYIRKVHGDLYGVGWDRCEHRASDALSIPPGTSDLDAIKAGYEARIAALEWNAAIGASRKVTGWMRGHTFIGLPESAMGSDTPVFTLDLSKPDANKSPADALSRRLAQELRKAAIEMDKACLCGDREYYFILKMAAAIDQQKEGE